MNSARVLCVLAAFGLLTGSAGAAPVTSTAVSKLPVREVTVFKDGNAFVLHRGHTRLDSQNSVVFDGLPSPILGTFWPFSASPGIQLQSVSLGPEDVVRSKRALSLREFLEANTGRRIRVTELDGKSYLADLMAVPEQPSEPGSTAPYWKGSVAVLKTTGGVRVVPVSRIRDLTGVKGLKLTLPSIEQRQLMTLRFHRSVNSRRPGVDVGLIYLERGIEWSPSYRVVIDGEGKATVQLQATLQNKLQDLRNTTVHLVIGAPKFDFKGKTDPAFLPELAARVAPKILGPYDTRVGFASALMSQPFGTYMGNGLGGFDPGAAGATMPDSLGEQQNPMLSNSQAVSGADREDLFVFSVRNVNLKKGHRLVLPVAEYQARYTNAYRLDLPVFPPKEVQRLNSFSNRSEVPTLVDPTVFHQIRLQNQSSQPWAQAPALVLLRTPGREEQLLSHSRMAHTAPGAVAELAVAAALDLAVARTDEIVSREAMEQRRFGEVFYKVTLNGEISIQSRRSDTVQVQVVRTILGTMEPLPDSGADPVSVKLLHPLDPLAAVGGVTPSLWFGYQWPSWWSSLNSIVRLTWDVQIKPGERKTLKFPWRYFSP